MSPEEINHALEHADSEEDQVYIIEAYLLTKEQKKALKKHKLSVSKLLNGRYDCSLEGCVIETFFKPWNQKLGKKEFTEEPIAAKMMESIQETFKDIMGEDAEIRFE